MYKNIFLPDLAGTKNENTYLEHSQKTVTSQKGSYFSFSHIVTYKIKYT